MFTSAFKKTYEIFAFPPTLLPHTWNWQNFLDAFTYQPFALHYINSLYIAVLVTLGTLFFSSMAGYAFARIPFWGSASIFLLLLSALMMPPEVTIVPNFILMQTFKLINTHVPLIIIPIFGANGVMSTFMMRQFFLNIPKEIEEAARMDGLNRFGIYWRVVLPMAKPALAAVAILTFLFSWNNFLDPLIYLNDIKLFTLPLSLRNFTDAYGQPQWNIQLAATVMSVLPVLIFYIIAQKQVMESFTSSGLKG
ncbi:MAG: carbohydrate ABC transporter permease [Chloroflexi bacterium]|nr:carbohydrate ABC transporter permease [Chloroflexota bacterium]